MIFIKFFKIPWYFQVFQAYSHFSRFCRSSGNPEKHYLAPNFLADGKIIKAKYLFQEKKTFVICFQSYQLCPGPFASKGMHTSSKLPEHGDEEVQHEHVGDEDVASEEDGNQPRVFWAPGHITSFKHIGIARTFHLSWKVKQKQSNLV